MTYNKKTNTLTAVVYEGIEPMNAIKHPYGYVAKVSKSLYQKLKVNQIINWFNPFNNTNWELIITKKANNTIWFYLP